MKILLLLEDLLNQSSREEWRLQYGKTFRATTDNYTHVPIAAFLVHFTAILGWVCSWMTFFLSLLSV